MKIYFARHGESEANLLREFSNTGVKHPLTERGQVQAHALAESLVGIPFAHIYTSPVLRAQQTAQIVAKRLGVPISVTEALREWDVGIYEGTSSSEGWTLHAQVMQDWTVHGKLESKMPGGESFLEIRQRFMPLIDQLLADGEQGDYLLMAHGGLYLAVLPALLTNVGYPFAFEQAFPYTRCVIAEARPEGWYCLDWCGIPPGER